MSLCVCCVHSYFLPTAGHTHCHSLPFLLYSSPSHYSFHLIRHNKGRNMKERKESNSFFFSFSSLTWQVSSQRKTIIAHREKKSRSNTTSVVDTRKRETFHCPSCASWHIPVCDARCQASFRSKEFHPSHPYYSESQSHSCHLRLQVKHQILTHFLPLSCTKCIISWKAVSNVSLFLSQAEKHGFPVSRLHVSLRISSCLAWLTVQAFPYISHRSFTLWDIFPPLIHFYNSFLLLPSRREKRGWWRL